MRASPATRAAPCAPPAPRRARRAAAAAAAPDAAAPPLPPAAAPASRRSLLAAGLAAAGLASAAAPPRPAAAVVKGYSTTTAMPALKDKDYGKPRMSYSDYVSTPSGLQYQDLVPGAGPAVAPGADVVVDWAGVTIGYYGRPFEARNKARGGAFTGDDKDFFRFRLGDPAVLPAFNEAVVGMRVGGVRRLIVPPEIGYPDNDYKKSAPRPTTFSGERALDFVLKNQGMIDKTLLFDIELLKVGGK
jgi:FKBP-type peptidyl-prolyl cis-trans isomerase